MTKLLVYGGIGVAIFLCVFEMGNRYGTNAWKLAAAVAEREKMNGAIAVLEKNDSMTYSAEEGRFKVAFDVFKAENTAQCATSKAQHEQFVKLDRGIE